MLQDADIFSGFSVDDLATALSFYKDTLGLAVEDTGMGLRVPFRSGGHVFIYEKSDHAAASYTVLNFVVEDIDAAVNELTNRGITMERYPDMPSEQDNMGILRGKTAKMGPDIAWFKDPAGNILSVLSN